jgi:hypothetical protein
MTPETVVRILAARCYFCGAAEGQPCRSVHGRACVYPHMSRITVAGFRRAPQGVEADDYDDAIDLYRDTVVELVFGYRTPELVALAMADRSIDERKSWVKKGLAGKPIHCKHPRIIEVAEDRYDPLFGDTPTERLVHRWCQDCGEEVTP